ncbi:low-affinity glucose transporter Hxt3p [Trichomonascus vanleenenianus]|uniref:sugar porter family MFS transporter n=1 Tax=Trichomonascus vanleenenianus TaxID=2268995 RepID=UPI003ECB3AF2
MADYQNDSSASSIKEEPDNMNTNINTTNVQSLEAEAAASEKGISDFILVITLCCFAAMGGFVFGYDTGTISGFINMPKFMENFGSRNAEGEYYMSKVRSGLLVGIFSIGAAIGANGLVKSADMWGRKKGIMLGCVVYIVGILIQITATNKWYQVFIGRLIGGVGIGALSVMVPMFQSETAPKEVRGLCVSSFQLFITLGIFIGYGVCYGTYDRNDTGSYRIPMGLCFAWALILLIGISFMPESPRYLVQNGQFEAARASLCTVSKRSTDDPVIRLEMDRITAGVEHEREVGKAGWGEVFTGQPRIGWRLMLGVCVQALQQLTGANYFFYYGTTIFKAIGMSNSYATSMIFGAVNFVSTFAAFYFVDHYGRRKCLFFGAISMFCFFIIYASLGTKALYPDGEGHPSNTSVGKGMIAVTCFFIFSFATTWAPIAYVFCAEIYPLRVKGKCMGIATGANWLANFLLSFFTPFITGAIGFKYGYVFAGCLAFATVFVFFFVPETKGLSLEQIDQMFASGVQAWKSESWAGEELVQPSSNYQTDKSETAHN